MKFSRRVWILSWISLFTDAASEMLYPVLPVYLKSIGFSMVLIGLLEGLAEAIAGLSKTYFGRLSDHSGRRAPFVQTGYGLSALAKPLIGLWATPLWVFFARTLDRLGKGIRTGARDALLSDEATPATKGRIFGFHRAMDTFGAVIGPLAALLYLHVRPGQYRTLFFLAFLPGLMALACAMLLRDKTADQRPKAARPGFWSSLNYWKQSPPDYRRLVLTLLFFALFNSSDVFLLLQIKAAGWSDSWVIGAYVFYNLSYVAAAYPAGALGDRFGLPKVLSTGVLLFALVYAGMAFSTQLWQFGLLFFAYGVYAACTEGIAKAWISNLTPPGDTATALGMYAGLQSFCALAASVLTGAVWYGFGPQKALLLSAAAAGLAFILLLPWTLRKSGHLASPGKRIKI